MLELFFDRLKVILTNPLWWILFAIAIFLLRIISTRHKYKKREPSTYSDLIKQYRERYMDAVYRMPECVKEIQERALNNFHIAKTPQEIISDLKQSSTLVSKDTLTNKRRSGGILLVAKMPIHTSLIEICQIFIRNNDIYITNNYYSDCGIFKLNTSRYKRYNVSWNPPDWKRFNYNRYIVSPNMALNLITETIKNIFDYSSKCETNAKYITRLNSLLNPYKIHTEMTQKSWNFFFDGTPISLEEAIKKLPDEVLSKRLDPPSSKPSKAPTSPASHPRPSTTTPAQKAPTPPPKAPSKPTKAPKPSQSQPKPSTPTPSQQAPTVPKSESKQSTSSAQQKIAKPITNFPFDLRYLPDLTFYSQEKAATVFPDIVGSGTLLISPSLSCNFAKIGLIIDNYLIQFDASGYMHILDIVKNEYQILNLSTIDKSDNAFKDWVMQISSGAPALNRIISNDQRAYKYLIAFTQLVYHHTYQGLEQEKYNMFLGAVQAAFGIPRNGNTLEIRNRVWYYNGEKQTWGQVAHSLFRDEKSQVFDLHSL